MNITLEDAQAKVRELCEANPTKINPTAANGDCLYDLDGDRCLGGRTAVELGIDPIVLVEGRSIGYLLSGKSKPEQKRTAAEEFLDMVQRLADGSACYKLDIPDTNADDHGHKIPRPWGEVLAILVGKGQI